MYTSTIAAKLAQFRKAKSSTYTVYAIKGWELCFTDCSALLRLQARVCPDLLRLAKRSTEVGPV